jgi:hypothetical protein
VDRIDEFEELRYPERKLSTGMFLGAGYHHDPPSTPPAMVPGSRPRYDLVLDDLDEVAAGVISEAPHNPAAFPLDPSAYAALNEENRSAVFQKFAWPRAM